MKYKIVIEKKAVKFLSKQPKSQQERILKAISLLPDNGNIKPLKGYLGYFRLRVGDYRIIYSIDDNVYKICVVKIGNRGDVYKNI
jgi:mRNA interferase RelE/StbE